MSRKFLPVEVEEFRKGFDIENIDSVDVHTLEERYALLCNEVVYQKGRTEFLKKKKSAIAATNDALGAEVQILSVPLDKINDTNTRLKDLADNLQEKEKENRALTTALIENKQNEPTLQEQFATELADINKRIEEHNTKNKALHDENTSIKTEFRRIFL